MTLKWRIAANVELLRLVNYIFPRNPSAARKLYARTRSQVRQLELFPKSGRQGRMKDTREFVVHGTPYLVVYTIKADTVLIMHILHTSRQWPPESE